MCVSNKEIQHLEKCVHCGLLEMLIDNIVVVTDAIITIIIMMDNSTIVLENNGKVKPIVKETAIANCRIE